jgi:predicted O-methyltransferase YrrM
MEHMEARKLVELFYSHLLFRTPNETELASWAHQLETTNSPIEVFEAFTRSREYVSKNLVKPAFPNGHFHSPVVDPSTIEEYLKLSQSLGVRDLFGIEVPVTEMRRFWLENLHDIQSKPFPAFKQEGHRFHYSGGPFPPSDAIILRAMIKNLRPRRIIEIGSGFTTACMLDTADDLGLDNIQITCIEPYPARLKTLLKAADYDRITIIEKGVQQVIVKNFEQLQTGDILFIDSTHVMKTGSDVHYEIFTILPNLKPGVVVHFHDIQFPFEYPSKWARELNFSWNEAYALRAFLMYNSAFRIKFWGGALVRSYPDEIRAEFLQFAENAGGSLWLSRN